MRVGGVRVVRVVRLLVAIQINIKLEEGTIDIDIDVDPTATATATLAATDGARAADIISLGKI